MSAHMKDNSIVIELTDTEATIARKILPIIEPFLTALTRDLIPVGLSLVVSMKSILKEYKTTGVLPPRDKVLLEADELLGDMKNMSNVEMINVDALMRVAEIDLSELEK